MTTLWPVCSMMAIDVLVAIMVRPVPPFGPTKTTTLPILVVRVTS
jgi:hypothetical protein